MLKAVIFDLNGVIIKSEYLSTRFEKTYKVSRDKFIPALNQIMEIVRKQNAPSIYPLWAPFFESWRVTISEDQFLKFWFSGETVNTEITDYVKTLKRNGLKVFVLSNNFKERTEFYRNNFPLIFENLEGAYFSWETGYVKPNKKAIEFVLRKHDLDPEEVVYFDNSTKNVDVAKEIGLDGQLWSDLGTAKQHIDSKCQKV